MPLPTEKSTPTLNLYNSKTLLYGAPGVGKTTLAATVDPDHTIILATEPGTGGLEAFVAPIRSWKEFREIGSDLANETHQFKIVVVDTADELLRQCQDHVMAEAKVSHPSDLEWGKGWQLLGDEFKLRVAKLCSLGMGVIFISHEKTEEIERKVGKISKAGPSLSGAGGRFLEGFVDYIFRAEIVVTEQGEKRILRTNPAENWVGKQRLPLPDPLPLDGQALAAALGSGETPADAPQTETLPLGVEPEKAAA